MDVIIANSKNVQTRIKKYLGLESHVIYPPCDTHGYNWLGQEDYYLSTARLEQYKRVDIIIHAFLQMKDKKLLVASSGTESKRLKQIAGGAENIKFMGWLSEEKLKTIVGNAIATIYLAKDEDFGMAPVESMASGKPVIGTNEGGLKETIVDNESGILVSAEPDQMEIIKAVKYLDANRAMQMRKACEKRARLFSKSKFFDEMKKVIKG